VAMTEQVIGSLRGDLRPTDAATPWRAHRGARARARGPEPKAAP
jgi:hypothetical protein